MSKNDIAIRGYSRSSKAWYAKHLIYDNIEVNFGMYYPNGGTDGEMTMEWIKVGSDLCAILKCFQDGWAVLSLFTDLIQKLSEVNSQLIQEEDFCKILDNCGFVDMTAYVRNEK